MSVRVAVTALTTSTAILFLSGCGGGGSASSLPVAPLSQTAQTLQSQQTVLTSQAMQTLSAGSSRTAVSQPHFANSPYTTPLPPNPQLAPNSAAMVNSYFGFGFSFMSADQDESRPYPGGHDYSHPLYQASTSDPVYRIHCLAWYGCASLEGQNINVPRNAVPSSGSDGHMVITSPDASSEADLWMGSYSGDTPYRPASPTSGPPYPTLNVGSGGIYNATGNGFSTSGDAVVGGNAASLGLVRGEEIQSGVLNHALFLVLPCGNGSAVYPSTAHDAVCSSTANAAPVGTRFFLALSDAQINGMTGLPTYMKPILTAMAHYGLFYGDSSGQGNLPNLQVPSTLTYTHASPAQTDPWVGIAAANGISYVYDRIHVPVYLPASFNWTQYLRVADPCVTKNTCVPVGSQNLHDAILADRPTVYHVGDDAGGTTWHDSSPNNRAGSITSSTAYHQPAVTTANPYSLATDGASGYMTSVGTQSGSFSLATYINIAQNRSNYATFASTSAPYSEHAGFSMALDVAGNNNAMFVELGYGSGYVTLHDYSGMRIGQNYFVALTYDANSRIATLYKDGVAVASATLPSAYVAGSHPLTFGRAAAFNGRHANVRYADTAYFENEVLPQSRIQTYESSLKV